MREGKGFLLVYSIASRNSFDEISVFKEKILRAKDMDQVPMVLVGNKCDLSAEERQVEEQEGKALAEEWGCPFMEVSAKEKIKNEECFFQVVREIRSSAGPEKTKAKKKGMCLIL